MRLLFTLIYLFIFLISHAQNNIETKFTPPAGFERIYNDTYSIFLRQQPLKQKNIVKFIDHGVITLL